ncbi:unnamed protein product, partial [Hapterophycus canaliculatus]
NTWSLPREGQHALAYQGPDRDLRLGPYTLLWAHVPDMRAQFADPANYDWPANRRTWYFQTSSADPAASVFVEKTPFHLLVADQLAQAFSDAFFVIMVRNPYATIEGIVRRGHLRGASRSEVLIAAACHVGACFETQMYNAQAHANRSLTFTYEDLCANPAAANARLRAALPELSDIEFNRRRPIKGLYDAALTDMNTAQIARLSQDDIDQITCALLPFETALKIFGYRLEGIAT